MMLLPYLLVLWLVCAYGFRWVATFTWPWERGIPLEMCLALVLVACIPIAGLANRLKLPLLGRRDGFLTFSKFSIGCDFSVQLPSETGFLIMYAPAAVWGALVMVAGTYSEEGRGQLLGFMMFVHFGKRCIECKFVHKYSGMMPVQTSVLMCFLNLCVSVISCYYASRVLNDHISSKMLIGGLLMFFLGISGTAVHHVLLANLRQPGESKYKRPEGAGFEYVTAPHYSCELIMWYGVANVSQHSMVLLVALVMTSYLAERASAQTYWHKVNKIDGFKTNKHLVPFMY